MQASEEVWEDDAGGIEPDALAAITGSDQSPIHAPGWPANRPQEPAPALAPNLTSPDASALTQAAKDKLKLIVARVERIDEEAKEIAEQRKEVFAEAKSMGYDTKALRAIVRERKQDKQAREEQEAILDVYRLALDMCD